MKNTNTILTVVVIFLVISNLFFGYMLLKPKSPQDFRGGFDRGEFQQMQLTDEQIENVKIFFQNTANLDEIKTYCDNNRMECFYYCREINSNHEICSQLMQGQGRSTSTDPSIKLN